MGELASGTTSIPDDEFVLRRIPPGEPWVRAELELTTANFKPRRHLGETGISVSRERLTSASELLARIPVEFRDRLGRGDLWRVARASVREIRNLGLDVVRIRHRKIRAMPRSWMPPRRCRLAECGTP